jgi:hypothetical protein
MVGSPDVLSCPSDDVARVFSLWAGPPRVAVHARTREDRGASLRGRRDR